MSEMKNDAPVETAIHLPVRLRQEGFENEGTDRGYALRDADGKALTGWGQVLGWRTTMEYIALCINDHERLTAALAAEQAKTKEYEADRVMLEDLYRVCPPRSSPDYEMGWNEAIDTAIDKFGRNAWVQEREAMLDEALQDEGTITALNAKVKRMEDALAQLCAKTESIELADGSSISYSDGNWWYFDKDGEGIASGDDPLQVILAASTTEGK